MCRNESKSEHMHTSTGDCMCLFSMCVRGSVNTCMSEYVGTHMRHKCVSYPCVEMWTCVHICTCVFIWGFSVCLFTHVSLGGSCRNGQQHKYVQGDVNIHICVGVPIYRWTSTGCGVCFCICMYTCMHVFMYILHVNIRPNCMKQTWSDIDNLLCST